MSNFQLFSDIYFIIGIKKSIDLQLEHSDAPIYVYQFSFDEKLGMMEKYIGDSTTPGMNFINMNPRKLLLIISFFVVVVHRLKFVKNDFLIPFYLQALQIHSANGFKLLEA
jgi:hypothetical protein